MVKTVLNIKMDKKVKAEAQEAARELGLPLGTIINAYLRELAREKRVVFSVPPAPNRKLQMLLKRIQSETRPKKRRITGMNYNEAVRHLDRL